jgi:hypothetical protein
MHLTALRGRRPRLQFVRTLLEGRSVTALRGRRPRLQEVRPS